MTIRGGGGAVVVTHGWLLTLEPLLTLLASTGLHVVVIDSGSEPGDLVRIQEAARRCAGVEAASHPNIGFGAAVNVGIKHLTDQACEVLLLVNPDVQIDAGAVVDLVAWAATHANTLVSPLILDGSGRVWFAGAAWRRLRRLRHLNFGSPGCQIATGVRESPFLPLTCIAGDAATFRRVGPLPEKYFLYWEDVVWSARALACGVSLQVHAGIRVRHFAGASSGGGESPTFLYYSIRNSTADTRERYSPWFLAARCLIVLSQTCLRIVLRRDRRWCKQLQAAVLGMIDGCRGDLSRTGDFVAVDRR